MPLRYGSIQEMFADMESNRKEDRDENTNGNCMWCGNDCDEDDEQCDTGDGGRNFICKTCIENGATYQDMPHE